MNYGMLRTEKQIQTAYSEAKEQYSALGVDTDQAIEAALGIPISLHCWQSDDVGGLETKPEAVGGGGIMATGKYPGKARTGDEIRSDLDQVLSLLPGAQRLNLHACYAETGSSPVDRDALGIEHFSRWVDWARTSGIGLDFNPTYFAHPKADDGYTLSHTDENIRQFWIRHGIRSREIAEQIAKALNSPCVNNHWVPDGEKDNPADRWSPRARLAESYDAIFDASHGIDSNLCIDAVESKLFGLGSEDYVVGSMEFYTGYALSRDVVQCLDMGHYHPTEGIADKISALLQFQKHLLIHTSRPVRWDSDHVVLWNDDVRAVFQEIQRGGAMDRVFVALDFFDASINRIAAYVIGTRATRKAILSALLDPTQYLQDLDAQGKRAQKLALMEEVKTFPFGAVWDRLCFQADVPVGTAWIPEVERYEEKVLSERN